ncbi:hypothetical protein [Colwellia sp. PAMC 21821]|uniref:hypothetical protein n=1 Tax=Colwellia sp. PAMC 21821 TaxID=1816219 RepID=UPI0009BD822A|nr:hypothetical protein [Colwellia sp. PAMC 21821]ARD44086.1 hypothetical protein A3Q33_07005 [Colwellia sp. PAMC 21821]
MDKSIWFNRCKLYFIFTLMAMLSQISHVAAQIANELELSAIASLDKAVLANDQWQSVLPVSGDEDQYFVATKAGKIYHLNHNEIAQTAFFDLKLALKNPNIIALTAVTLDPNFHYRDRDGYQTFYTAHTETSKKTKSKLTPKNTEIIAPYDAVIIRWQITGLQNETPQLSQQYEVMRIAIMQPQEHIQLLSFNPYVESWHDDFGLLFIALALNETLKSEALYAGSILRIKPEKYGLLNYTIPVDNPFTKTDDIRNEIVFIAGHKSEHFDWIKKSTYSFLIQLNQQDVNMLVEAKIGDDWRKAIPQAQIKKSLPVATTKHKTILYHGRELKTLWGKALQLQETENAWQLQAITLNSSLDSEDEIQDIPYKLIKENPSEQSKFSLHQNHNGELLLLEHNQQRLYTINIPIIAETKNATNEVSISSSNTKSIFAFLFVMILILASYFLFLKNKGVVKKSFLQRQWANFELDVAEKSLSLYKRHAKNADKTIDISSLTRSELLLNDEVISTVSDDSLQAFPEDAEDIILTLFAKERRLKMSNEKQRSIQIRLTDDQKNHYLFCLYFRVGNIRHTRLTYQEVTNKAIDWQQFFAQYINQNITVKRKNKVNLPHEIPSPSETKETSTVPKTQPETHEDNSTLVTSHSNNTDLPTNNTQDGYSDPDSKLVEALDKLIIMKKQGYLSESEYNVAKTNILQELTND